MFKKRLMFALLLGALFTAEPPIALATNASISLSSEIVTAGSTASYVTTIMQQANGTASLSTSTAAAGSTVTVTVTPSSGYVSGGIAVADAKNNVITTSKLSATKYSFTMPDSEATVIPVFLAADSPNASSSSADSSTSEPESEPTAPESESSTSTDTNANTSHTSASNENKTESVVVIPSDSNVHLSSSSDTSPPIVSGVDSTEDNAPSASVVSGGDNASSAPIIIPSGDSSESTSNAPPISVDDSGSDAFSSGESALNTPTASVVIPSDSNASHAPSGSGNESIFEVSYADDVSSGNIVPIDDDDGYTAYASVPDTSGVIVPSGGSSVDSSPFDHIASGNSDGTISSTIVIPSENGTAEPDTLPIGDVIVPGSHLPTMMLPDSSASSENGNQTQTGSDTKMIYSKTHFEDSVSTVTGTTQVPDVLDTIGKPDVRLSSHDGETVEEKGIPSPKILSATVPLVLPVRTAADGKVIVPTNAEIISDVRQGNLCIDSVRVRFASGWIPASENAATDENTYAMDVSLREDGVDSNGNLELTKKNWVIRPKKGMPLRMNASLEDNVLLTNSPVAVEFTLDWA